MRRVLLGLLVVAAAPVVCPPGGGLPAWEAAAAARESRRTPPPSAGPLYRGHCLRCHDADGTGRGARGTMPEIPDFTGPRWQQGRTDAQLLVSILEGKGTRMPAFAGKVSKDQARALAAFLRSFGPARAKPAAASRTRPPSSARGLYQMHCGRCHDGDGTGSSTEGTRREPPDFTSCRWQKRRTDAQLFVSILEGKGRRMPAFAGKVSKDQAQALVAFVRSFPLTQAKATEQPADDFEERFRRLEEEFEQLRERLRALSRGKRRDR